jgi:hypothetical protein
MEEEQLQWQAVEEKRGKKEYFPFFSLLWKKGRWYK